MSKKSNFYQSLPATSGATPFVINLVFKQNLTKVYFFTLIHKYNQEIEDYLRELPDLVVFVFE